ncbi:hypothetical protein [Teichococcus vastitatis]|uniref:DNA transfer protein n=1 Tax=Teichococcus vastitatis TaxID=2307076 RepID=A0ABS9WBU0_9PROT|nr:hypothetical protein [Pseudoroseomonas vastitatis]MCI0756688.1 hypothetical protein [Pseudoroseomonas vastitatis]
MATFDVKGALAEGYSLGEIAEHVAKSSRFDLGAARQEGYSDAEIVSHLTGFVPPMPAKAPADTRSSGEVAANSVGLFGRGFNDRLADVVGAPVDLVTAGMNYLGADIQNPIGGSESIKSAIRGVTDIAGAPAAPTTTAEELAYGAGTGVADAATVVLPAAAVARTARAGSAVAAGAETLAAQPVLQAASGAAAGATTEATDNPWLGMAAGMSVPLGASMGTRLVSPTRSTLNPEQARLATVIRNEGVELTPGQATGSKPLHMVESSFAELPFTSSARQAEVRAQQNAFNRAALQRAGIQEELATPDVLVRGRDDLGNEFTRLSSQNTLDANNSQFVNDLVTLDNSLVDASSEVAGRVTRLRDELLDHVDANGRISGAFYQRFQSRLSKIARENGQSNPELRNRVLDLRNVVRNAMEQSISPGDAADWRDVTRRYANLKNIETAMAANPSQATAGNISPSALYQAVNRSTGGNAALGRGDLRDLAAAGIQFLREPIGNSGTAGRAGIMSMLKGEPLRAGIAAATLGGPTGLLVGGTAAAAAGTAAVVLPKAVQTAYNNRLVRSYLTNQLANNYRARRALPGVVAGELVRRSEGGDD